MTSDVLSVSLATEPRVGTNVRGAVSGAGWLYALPSLEYDRIVCLGLPQAPTLAALARAGQVTLQVRRGQVARARAAAARIAPDRLTVVQSDRADDAPIDLLVLDAVDRGEPALGQALARVRRGGSVVDLSGRIGLELPDPGEWTCVDLRRWPEGGEVRAIARSDRPDDVAALQRSGLLSVAAGSDDRRFVARAARWVRRRLRRPRRWGPAVLAVRVPSADPGPPRYIQELAASAGRDLTGWGWAVAARGDYDSQKVLLLLREPGAAQPSGVVKVARSAAHAERLANEADALAALAASPLGAGRVPAPWFAGTHAGRGILAQSMLVGVPFRTRATFSPDDPLLDDALGWLTDLAVETARPEPAAEIATVLERLLERFERIYTPSGAERAALQALIAGLRDAGPIPIVRQHGDPGIWNLLATDDGRTAFLDWEASEANGLPLWDLLYLYRSYVVAATRRSHVRDVVAASGEHLIGASPLAARLRVAIDAYAEAVGVGGETVEALTYGCWIHRALKEASRLPAERLGSGTYVRHIRSMLASRDSRTPLVAPSRQPASR